MPGRQSTGPPSLKKARATKYKGKRSQNALAIAEQEAPVLSKIRPNRLGQSEPEISKRKRQDENDDEDSDFEGGNEHAKRRKAEDKDRYGNEIERGSDSSGNEWTVGQVNEDDDSDIDSDEAMAESDDEGAAIKGSKFHSSGPRRISEAPVVEVENDEPPDVDLREDSDVENDIEGDDDSFGDEAVDLAAMLDESDDGEGLPSGPKKAEPFMNEQSDNDSNESDVATEPTSEDEESTFSYSETENDAGDATKLAALQALMSTMNDQDQTSTRAKAPIDAQESMTPSDFATSKRKLNLRSTTDIESGISLKLQGDNKGKASGKRSGIPGKLNAPLPKRQQDRLDRAAAYEKSKETLSRWIDTVKNNRRAEHLSFPLRDPNAVAAQGSTRLLSTTQTQPLTDLESTIQDILQESGLVASNGKSGEDQLQAFEELKTNKMPIEEVQARQAELRKARELLFREEIRARRIKKIKSKTYRKLHRRERERNAQHEKDALTAAGVDDSESEQERKDRRRAEERMGARHRESRWAKGVKESGRSKWDEDARDGVTEMARRGEELKRRIHGRTVAEEEDGMISSESYDDDEVDPEGGDAEGDRQTQKLNNKLSKLGEDGNGFEPGAKGSRLASMDFMKNAEKARKARNEADLESLRRDVAGEETPSESEDEEGPGRKIFGPAASKPLNQAGSAVRQNNEFEEGQGSDDEERDVPVGKPGEDELEIIVDGSNIERTTRAVKKPSLSDKRRKGDAQANGISLPNMSENPWLMPSKTGSNVGKKRAQDADNGAIISTTLPVTVSNSSPAPRSALKGARKADKARDQMHIPNPTKPTEASAEDEEDDDTDKLPFVLRNQDLVRKAFAGDEVVADFEAEKRAIMEDEEEKVIDNTLPGWGSWTGAGLGKKQQKRNKGKVLSKQPGIAKDKRQDAKLDRVVINEKRVKKNSRYLASSLPHPFETRQQYQRSLRMPVGPEFATKLAFQDATKPRILMKQGIITPMVKPII